jgi:hypothetical protein
MGKQEVNSMLRHAALVIALIAATWGEAAAQLLAQVNPVKLSLTARPGQPLHRDVQVLNLGDRAVAVRLRLSDWRLSEDGELSLAAPGRTPGSLLGVAQFEPEEFTLAPGQNRWVHVTLALPEQGSPTRWGVLLSSIRPASTSDSAALAGIPVSARSAELGTTIFISRIPADEARAAIGTPIVTPLGGDSILVAARVHNVGQRQVNAGVEFTVSDSAGSKVRSGPGGSGIVLPGETRRFRWICVASLRPGAYVAGVKLDGGGPDSLGSAPFRWPPAGSAGSIASHADR